jgi:superfamily II RNA helicase
MIYRGFELDPFQAEAIAHLREGRSVLVAAPTGTGKTIIADYVVDQALAEGREVVYTAPIKALSNQKYRDYTRLHGRSNIGLVTGDLVINQDAQIRIMTTEILRNILLQGTRSPDLSHVIIDEVHFLDDEERGTVWEELLIYLPRDVKIVALSATLPNIEEFAQWLEYVRGEPVSVVKENRRAVPLRLLLGNRDIGVHEPREFDKQFKAHLERQSRQPREREEEERRERGHGGRYGRTYDRRGRPADRGNPHGAPRTRHLDMVELARPYYLPLLYFVFSRRQTESFARELSRRTRSSFLNAHELGRMERFLDEFEAQNKDVLTPEHRAMYTNGIAFHHAGLHVSLKALVEELYEQRLIHVLYCTSTFALGINMPARTVIFDSLRKFNGVTVAPLTVRQFLQKAGRAGRRGMDKIGYVVVREDFSEYPNDRDLIHQYQRGEHEPINSAFNLSFSSIVNLLARHTEAEIQQILDKSFLNFAQSRALERERANLEELMAKIDSVRRGEAGGNGRGRRDTLKKWRKRAARIERELEGQEGRLWAKFKEKEDFLKLAGYLEDDGSFNAGARALMNIQIGEVFVTELLLEGVFEEVDEDELFGILTALVHEFPRSVVLRDPLRGRWLKLRDRLRRIKDSEVVSRGAEFLPTPITFCPELMPFGHLWAQGHSLAALMLLLQSDIDVSGDLVGAFRRAKDLAGQIRAAYKDNDFMVARLNSLIKKVSRDEVEVID